MEKNGNPLLVQDILSVFESIDRSHRLPAAHIAVQLLTSDGVLALKIPRTLTQNLAEELARAAVGRGAWVPDYCSAERVSDVS